MGGGLLFSLGACLLWQETRSSAPRTGKGRGFEKTREGIKEGLRGAEATARVVGDIGLLAGMVLPSAASCLRGPRGSPVNDKEGRESGCPQLSDHSGG